METLKKHDRIVPNEEYEMLLDSYNKLNKINNIENICERFELARSIEGLRAEMTNTEMALEIRKEMLEDLKNNKFIKKLDEFELLKGGTSVLGIDGYSSSIGFNATKYKFEELLRMSKVYDTHNYRYFVEFCNRNYNSYCQDTERNLIDIFLKLKLLSFIFDNGNLQKNGTISLKGDVDAEIGELREENSELKNDLVKHQESYKISRIKKDDIITDLVKTNQRKRGIIFIMGVVITVLTGFLIFG